MNTAEKLAAQDED